MTRKFTRAAAIAAASMIEIASARTSSQTAGPRPAATRRPRKERTMIRKLTLVLALAATVFGISSASACKIVGHTSDGEPLCMTTSDGAGQPYNDDRYRQRWQDELRWQEERQRTQRRREYIERYRDVRRRQEEGRSQWQNDGMKTERVGTISPFVPGSVQDTAWREERRKHGIQ